MVGLTRSLALISLTGHVASGRDIGRPQFGHPNTSMWAFIGHDALAPFGFVKGMIRRGNFAEEIRHRCGGVNRERG